jgi:hypothetical protein
MENQHNQPDAAIDKTLAALNSAAPPEGLDTRIAARIAAQPAPAVSPWRDRLTGYTLASAWWRGALTGAVAAMLALTAVLLLQHHSQTAPSQVALNEGTAARGALSMPAAPVAQVKADTSKLAASPCPPVPNTMQLRRTAPEPKATLLRVASTERHPILSGPLTAQERGLLLLARTADPQQLAMLNSEAQAKLKAEDAAEFEKFFAPPPQPKTQQENE